MGERITEAEFAVMGVLWDEAPLAATEIAYRLRKPTGWSAATVKTLLSRLVDKGAVDAAVDGRRFLYSPKISRGSYAHEATQSFLSRMFGGRAAPLVAHLADAGALTRDDIAELEALLEGIRNDRR